MIEQLTENDPYAVGTNRGYMTVICMHLDSIKTNQGVYYSVPRKDAEIGIKLRQMMGYEISHGICPPCYDKVIEETKEMKLEGLL